MDDRVWIITSWTAYEGESAVGVWDDFDRAKAYVEGLGGEVFGSVLGVTAAYILRVERAGMADGWYIREAHFNTPLEGAA